MATAEKESLQRRLGGQREHVLGILDGLSDEHLRRPVLPSGWSCLGMVQHLTLADEYYWFGCVVAGHAQDRLPTEPDREWVVGPELSAADVFHRYRDEAARSDAIIASTDLDAAPEWTDPRWKSWPVTFPDLRTIMLHVLVETSVHAGHLDAIRELIDGRQWIVL